jgi:hypothetical protein
MLWFGIDQNMMGEFPVWALCVPLLTSESVTGSLVLMFVDGIIPFGMSEVEFIELPVGVEAGGQFVFPLAIHSWRFDADQVVSGQRAELSLRRVCTNRGLLWSMRVRASRRK